MIQYLYSLGYGVRLGFFHLHQPQFPNYFVLEISKDALLTLPDKIRPDHIYLDVTFTDYKSLRNAYKAVSKCRELLGIDTSDVRKGALESIDYLRTLMCARGEERGLSRKEMAEILDFKIYYRDNPSGSYPLLQKYLKVGRRIL